MFHCRTACLALLCLSGCAQVNWERALYEGQRSSAEQCRVARRPSDPPCANLPDYDQYEKARAAAASASAPAR